MKEVDDVIAAPFAHGKLQLGLRRRVAADLKARRYDRAYVLPNTWKAALVPFLAGIPERIGYRGEMRYGLVNRLQEETGAPMREHYALLAGSPGKEPLSIPRLRADAPEIAAAQKKFGIEGAYAVLCPGAEYGPAKRWPHFAQLASAMKIPAVILGSTSDQEASKGIPGKDLAGKTTLDEAICLIAGAAVVVTNDSGLMHVAAALARPQVALFGSSSPEHTPPQSAAARVLWLKVECSPCFQRVCPLGHFKCMNELTPARVLAEIKSLA
jgi:heptosyltransferase-2